MKFGDNLKNLRKRNKLSQEDLADKMRVSRQSVSKWECGDAYPEMSNILELCKIFHCKINDLVHENISDIELMDEEVKKRVVKLDGKKQEKMKLLSKVIYRLALICRIGVIMGIAVIILTMIIIPFVYQNVKVLDKGIIEIFGEKVNIDRTSSLIKVGYQKREVEIIKNNDVVALNLILDNLENGTAFKLVGFIELAFAILILMLYLMVRVFKCLESLFRNIHDGDTPFTKENVLFIKRIATLLIGVIILPNVSGILAQQFIGEDLDIGLELMDFIYILILFSMAYIFEYGYEIQRDSMGVMYE